MGLPDAPHLLRSQASTATSGNGRRSPQSPMLRPRPDPAAVTAGVTTTVLRHQSELDELGAEWRELHAASPAATPFQSHAWIAAWARAYVAPGRLRVVLARRDGRLVAALPLHLERRGPWRVLAPLGGAISDHTDGLFEPHADDAVRAALTDALLREPGWSVVDLPEIRPGADVLAWVDSWPGRVTRLPASTCLELPAQPVTELLTRMPGRTANTMRRKLRKIDGVGIVVRDAEPGDLPEAVGALLRLHAEQWAGRGGTPEHFTDRFRTHLTEAVTGLAADGGAAVAEYRLDGELLLSQILLTGHDELSYYLAGISPRLREKVDAAALLVQHDVETAVERGLSRYSMLRGLEDYKLRWRPDVVVQERVLLVRPGASTGAGHPAAVLARRALVGFAKARLPWVRDLRDRVTRRSAPDAGVGGPPAMPTVDVLTEPAQIGRWLPAWDGVPGTTDPVGGAAWTQAWSEVYGEDHALTVGVAGEPASPQAVVPLVRRTGRPWWLETLGVRQLAEPTDVRAGNSAALNAVLREVARSRRALRLKRLPAGSPVLDEIRSVYGRRALVLTRPVEGTPTLPLDASWSAPESKLSSRRRGDLRAAWRRASELGSVELDVLAPTPAEFGPLFDDFLRVEASGWKTAAGTALAVQPQMQRFYRRFAELAAERGELRLAFLRIDGRPVAGQLAIEHAGRYNLLKIGFDEAFARCSPGNLLMVHALGWAADRGLASFEFLGVAEPWIGVWTQADRACVEIHVYPCTQWGALACVDMTGELMLRGIRRGLAKLSGVVGKSVA